MKERVAERADWIEANKTLFQAILLFNVAQTANALFGKPESHTSTSRFQGCGKLGEFGRDYLGNEYESK